MSRRFELDVMGTTGTALGHRNPRRVDATSLRRLLDDAYAGRRPGTNRTTARSA